MNFLGLDIGGANIKVATADGESASVPFAIWKSPGQLTSMLAAIPLCRQPRVDLVALTMTAELADCFATKSAGVAQVISSTRAAFPDIPLRVWLTSGEFAEPDDAMDLWSLAAAANWHALATWAARAVPGGPALLIDVGSTTTDVIPLCDGMPASEGTTDVARLAASELIYSGVRRTPVCAMVRSVPVPRDWRGPQPSSGRMPIAAELFATALDVHLLTDGLPEAPHDTETADGRCATRAAARNRLAHQLCCDTAELTNRQLEELAEFIAGEQLRELAAAVENRARYALRLAGNRPAGHTLPVLISGSGAWLAEKALADVSAIRFEPVISLSSMFVRNVSPCATAFAVARLAAERCRHDALPLTEQPLAGEHMVRSADSAVSN